MAISNKPYEIVAFPYVCWLGPGGTAIPTLEAIQKTREEEEEVGVTPKLTGYQRIGTSGALNYNESGVTVNQPQTIQTFTGAGATMPRKGWRTDAAIEVSFELVDLSAKQAAYVAFDDATVTVKAGVTGSAAKPGEEHFSLNRGPLLYNYAMVLFGISPMDANLSAMYYMPSCYQSASPSVKYSLKGGPAMLALQFTSILENQGAYPEWWGSIEP